MLNSIIRRPLFRLQTQLFQHDFSITIIVHHTELTSNTRLIRHALRHHGRLLKGCNCGQDVFCYYRGASLTFRRDLRLAEAHFRGIFYHLLVVFCTVGVQIPLVRVWLGCRICIRLLWIERVSRGRAFAAALHFFVDHVVILWSW